MASAEPDVQKGRERECPYQCPLPAITLLLHIPHGDEMWMCPRHAELWLSGAKGPDFRLIHVGRHGTPPDTTLRSDRHPAQTTASVSDICTDLGR